MAQLPQYGQRIRQPGSGGGRVGGIEAASAAARPVYSWADAMQEVGGSLDRLAQPIIRDAEATRTADAAELGRNAIELDEQGKPRAPVLRANDSAVNRAWNSAVVKGYEDATEQQWASRFVAEREKFRDDADGFRRWAAGSVEGATAEMDPRLRGPIGARLSALAEGHFRAITADGQQRRLGQARQDWSAQLGVVAEEIGRFALVGQADTPAAADARERFQQHLAAGRAAGHLTEAGEALTRQQVASNATAFALAGRAETIARTQGPDAAARWLDESLADPRFAAAGNQALREARAAASARIGFVEADRRVEARDVGRQLTTVRESLQAGVQVPGARLEEFASRADRVGLGDAAADFRALALVQGEVASLARAPLPRLLEAMASAQSGDAADPSAAVRVREIRELVKERAKSLRDDPVAWADGDASVAAVRQRVAGGQAAVADVVRARDAVLRENGVDPSMGRVMTQAEAKAVVQRVEQAPPSEATAALTGTLAAYGPEMRWRVQNDLRAAGLAPAMRPVAIMLASPGGESSARAYIEAIREGDEALNRPLAEDTRKQVREKIASAMEGVRETLRGTGGAMDLANDMERAVDVLARVYARTSPPREAADRAHREVVDRAVEVVRWDNASLRVPRGVKLDQPQFRQALNGLSRSLDEVEVVVPPGAVSGALTPPEAQAAYRASLRSSGVWLTDHDGMGAVLHDDQGRPVVFNRGGAQTPYRLRFDDDAKRPPVLEGGNYGTVRRLAAAGGVDADWAASIARVENGGRTTGTSSAGALGLMQVMPATAREVAGRLGIATGGDFEARLNRDPEMNARIGVAYLREVSDAFPGNRVLATAAYNAGPERVRKWLSGRPGDLPDETVAYVRKVLGTTTFDLTRERQRWAQRASRADLTP